MGKACASIITAIQIGCFFKDQTKQMNKESPVMWKAGLGDQGVFFLVLVFAKYLKVQALTSSGFKIVLHPKGVIHVSS